VWLDRHGNRVGTVGDPAFYGDNFRISPDGQRLAVDITANGNTDIYVLGLKDNSSTRLTFDAAPDLWSVWSLDGKSVLFRSERVPTGDIYQVPADGTGADKLFFHSDFAKFPLEWSPPDGKYLMFVDRQPKGDFDSRVFSPADGKAAPWLATSNLEWYQRISPDGRWVAYVSNETGGSEIFVRPFSGPARDGGLPAGGKWKVSETTGHLPHWRQDSRELFYITLSGDLMSVSLTAGPSFRAEPPKKLFALPPYSPFEVAENGARILALLPEQQSKSSPITVVLNWERLLKR
jgi:Tol biopolymer transport system component